MQCIFSLLLHGQKWSGISALLLRPVVSNSGGISLGCCASEYSITHAILLPLVLVCGVRGEEGTNILQHYSILGVTDSILLQIQHRGTLLMKWQVSFLIVCPPSLSSVCSRVSQTSNGWVTPKLSWVTGTWKTRSILLWDGKMEQRVTALNALCIGSWFPSRGCLLLNNRYQKEHRCV